MLGGARRRLAGLLAVGSAALLGGCGAAAHTGSSTGGPGSIVAGELSYLAPGAPFVVTVATSQTSGVGNFGSYLGANPQASSALSLLGGELGRIGLSYGNDIKPLLGHPVMIGAGASTLSGANRRAIVGVWETSSASALARVLGKLPGFTSTASYDGAKLYALGTSAEAAVSGATLIVSTSLAAVQQALDRHAHAAGFSAAEYSRLSTGLPAGARVTVVGDLTGVLSTSKAAKARRVPWVAALRGYGAAISAGATRLGVTFRLDTSGAPLSSGELPLAPATAAPQLAGSMPITVGFTDPAHTFSFLESTEQLTGAKSFADFLGRQQKLKAKTGSNLSDLISQFTGGAIVGSDTHTTLGRVQVADGAKAATTLAALARDPADALGPGASARSLGQGFYSLVPRHRSPVTVGVVRDQFVAGTGSVAALKAFAAAPATAGPSGSGGSLTVRIGLRQLIETVLRSKTSSPLVAALISRLGDVTGSASNTATGLSGVLSLALGSAG